MKTKPRLFGLALIVLAVIGYVARRPSTDGVGRNGVKSETEAKAEPPLPERRGVVLRVSPSQSTNAVAHGAPEVFNFEIQNNGHSPIVCPDGWYLEFEDGSVKNLSLPQSGNIRVAPGKTGAIAIASPGAAKPWRLGASYYAEDIVFDVKVKIDQSPLKNHLPPGVSSVRGKNVVSDWVK